MIDIKYLRNNTEKIDEEIKKKGEKINFTYFLETDKKRKEILTELEKKRSILNKKSKEIAKIKKEKKDAQNLYEEVKLLSNNIKMIEQNYKNINNQWKNLYNSIPNYPEDDIPEGENENDNITISTHGNCELIKNGLDHLQISKKYNLLDFNLAAKVSKSAFPLYIGAGARLESALISFMLKTHIENNYTELIPPYLVNRNSCFGTGQLPKMEDDLYLIESEDIFLNPTAEVPVTNLYRDSIINVENFPIKYCALTTCFRKEAGSYGKLTKGLLRMHQFNKVELVHIVRAENGRQSLKELLAQSELILKKLKLPYRVRLLCKKEMSFASAITYDIEVWSPISRKFLEVSSVSYFRDFQSRRINIKYKKDKTSLYAHTLNGSALATPRTMIAILENNIQEDGRIKIPEVLLPYFHENTKNYKYGYIIPTEKQ